MTGAELIKQIEDNNLQEFELIFTTPDFDENSNAPKLRRFIIEKEIYGLDESEKIVLLTGKEKD
jgi:hypothetical protein